MRGKEVVKELQGGPEGRQRALPRHRRRPRGRGHLVAPPRAAEAQGAGQADGVPRDHQVRHRPRRGQPPWHRLRPGRRGRDPPHPRPPLRLRGLAGAVAPGQPRPVGRPGAEPVDPPRRRARARAHARSSPPATGTSSSSPATAPSFIGHARRPRRHQGRHRQGLRRRRPAERQGRRRRRGARPAPGRRPAVVDRSRSAPSRRSRTAPRRRPRS